MKIAMMTEGTYPHQFGGVSVWCDQLVRGMPEHDFHVVALVATGAERLFDPRHFEFRGGRGRPPELRGLRSRVSDQGD